MLGTINFRRLSFVKYFLSGFVLALSLCSYGEVQILPVNLGLYGAGNAHAPCVQYLYDSNFDKDGNIIRRPGMAVDGIVLRGSSARLIKDVKMGKQTLEFTSLYGPSVCRVAVEGQSDLKKGQFGFAVDGDKLAYPRGEDFIFYTVHAVQGMSYQDSFEYIYIPKAMTVFNPGYNAQNSVFLTDYYNEVRFDFSSENPNKIKISFDLKTVLDKAYNNKHFLTKKPFWDGYLNDQAETHLALSIYYCTREGFFDRADAVQMNNNLRPPFYKDELGKDFFKLDRGANGYYWNVYCHTIINPEHIVLNPKGFSNSGAVIVGPDQPATPANAPLPEISGKLLDLKNQFENALNPDRKDIIGWHSGRCYYREDAELNKPGNRLMVGRSVTIINSDYRDERVGAFTVRHDSGPQNSSYDRPDYYDVITPEIETDKTILNEFKKWDIDKGFPGRDIVERNTFIEYSQDTKDGVNVTRLKKTSEGLITLLYRFGNDYSPYKAGQEGILLSGCFYKKVKEVEDKIIDLTKPAGGGK